MHIWVIIPAMTRRVVAPSRRWASSGVSRKALGKSLDEDRLAGGRRDRQVEAHPLGVGPEEGGAGPARHVLDVRDRQTAGAERREQRAGALDRQEAPGSSCVPPGK